LAIDGSRVFSDRRHAQNAADAAALSAALAKIRGDPYVQAAHTRAADNGYAITENVEVHLCSELIGSQDACVGIPTSSPEPAQIREENYIQVKITSILPATFARIVGRNEFKNVVTSVAYAGPVEPQPLVKGNALAAMNPTREDAILGGGNMNLDVNNSGIFSNSTFTDPACNNGSLRTFGNGVYSVDTSIQVAGSYCPGVNTTMNGPWSLTGTIDYPPAINIPIPSISCSGSAPAPSYNASSFTLTYHPGSYNHAVNPDNDAPPGKYVREAHFSPGRYCLSNGASFDGPNVIANGVRFLVSGGSMNFNGGVVTCNDMLVHVNGGNGVNFTGTGQTFCNSVTFIASTGGINWDGALENRMFAPMGGDYKGVLLYLPYPNDAAISINGNSSNQLTGSIIGVASPISVYGNDWTTGLNSQIIGNTVTLDGNGTLVINYIPNEQYMQVDPSAIQLTK
jgi:hypothetical protein